MPGMKFPTRLVFFAAIALSLCACSKPAGTAAGGATAADSGADVVLPKPEANGGSVTGMPSKPGPNPVGPALAASASVVAPMDTTVQPTADSAGEVAIDAAAGDDDATPAAAADAEPSAQDALAVLQDYYVAINQRDFQRAWSSWSDGGRSSGQTAQQFADGFANTAQVALQPGVPGRVDAAAGSRYVEIPVAIQATQRDGTVHRYTGTYTLRRAVVDGATDAQRAWHIGSAALHEIPQ
jgi:hypothetical protein